MNTYPTTTLSKPSGSEPIPIGVFGYLRSRNKHRIYSLVMSEFQKSGLSHADLARRLGKKPDVVCRWLATPGNWQIDSVSDLVFAISGATVRYELDFPLDQSARNDTRPQWLTGNGAAEPNGMDSAQFRTWRRKRYRTQDEAGQAFDVTRETIHCWERNKTPGANWRMIELACKGLDLERRESERAE